ncbi:hypothetical protein W97_00858 [Coniosporium apollinis CBS 100218]|uniref:Uncharacterized protein n=1 Tax=Coniosporium apollinis (strain CBS 100218) TaxID=1168221 RepID=R7YIB1_CONA1|nr:uncharacterized protein W97_00858 [Coniosporium apollinis CBS 100218]EON61642.1 hypothetical protein W97_00858 [Coniosporium apollinis CBS 100218]
MATAQSSTLDPTTSDASSILYEQLDQYPWDTDAEFQGGLAAILGPNPSPEQAADLTLHARCFYFSRKFNTHVDFDGYNAWRRQQNTAHAARINGDSSAPAATSTPPNEPQTSVASSSTSTATTAVEPAAPYPTSFAHIVELITTGQPIPGIKEIPSTVLEGQGTQSVKERRKKPWEKDTSEAVGATSSTEA